VSPYKANGIITIKASSAMAVVKTFLEWNFVLLAMIV
jgi:hypothetical protein